MKKLVAFSISLFLLWKSSSSQLIIVNEINKYYFLNSVNPACVFQDAGYYCGQDNGQTIFSTALHNDTLYFIDPAGRLFRMKIGRPESCKELTSFNVGLGGAPNSLTSDRYGILYAVDPSRKLIRYNPYTNLKEVLGEVNASSAGDLIFYKDKLLMASIGLTGIVEINISNPPASVQYMPTVGYVFWGLVSMPFNCEKNKYYGLSLNNGGTDIIELDMEARAIVGQVCQIPVNVFDAASNVDDGNTIGVTVDTMIVNPACGPFSSGNIQIMATTAVAGGLTYVLDGVETNTTGFFTNLSVGLHNVRITNRIDCIKDTSFYIYGGLNAPIALAAVNPQSCTLQNGSINISSTSPYPPLLYSIDGGTFQATGSFNNLPGGLHVITMKDAKGCQRDTNIILSYLQPPTFLSSLNINPTICNGNTGSITVNLATGVNPGDVMISLNNGSQQPALGFQNLDGGQHLLSLFYLGSCRYDTLISIPMLTDPEPDISFDITDQLCLINNGAVRISVTGADNPYTISFNNGSYTANTVFNSLAPGIYDVKIRNKNTCITDTSVEVKPYIKLPYTTTVDKIDPTCKVLTDGSIRLNINGGQSPYSFKLNNNVYANGAMVSNLTEGNYTASIINNDNCVIDSVKVELKLQLSAECNYLFVPSAFTPNDDGLNDFFKAYAGAGVNEFELIVFNRWGQRVFSTKDKSKGWDGRFNGKRQGNGVYVWTIRYKTLGNIEEKFLKGTVTLIH